MPIPTIYINRTETASLKAVTDAILDEMDKQTIELMKKADGSVAPKNEFTEKYLQARQAIVDFTVEKMATSISLDLFTSIFEKASMSLDIQKPIKNKGDVGGFFGKFIEREAFGIDVPEDLPVPDLEEIKTEIKGVTSDLSIKVGGVALSGVTYKDSENFEMRNLVMLEKMARKMANFLLFKISSETTGRSTAKIHFNEITLYVGLILIKLWQNIKSTTETNRIIKLEPGKAGYNNKTMTMHYVVRIKLTKTNDIYDFAKLYLYKTDLKKEMKTNPDMRKKFWVNFKKGNIEAAKLPPDFKF